MARFEHEHRCGGCGAILERWSTTEAPRLCACGRRAGFVEPNGARVCGICGPSDDAVELEDCAVGLDHADGSCVRCVREAADEMAAEDTYDRDES